MFMDRLLNQGSVPLLEQMIGFTGRRHQLILENLANVDTPGYRQRDLSVKKFTAMLRERVERRRTGLGPVRFDDVAAAVENPTGGILFHDGNNRSLERLMSDLAGNAMMHNMAIELLRKQHQGMEMALRERVG